MSDVIEPAATGRAKCRRCQEKIEKGALRFGERVPNAFGEGQATLWYHLACAGEKRPDKLAQALAEYPGELPDRSELERIVADGIENPALAAVLRVEAAPTGRATCQHCRVKIEKGALRVALEQEGEPMSRPTVSYIHAACARGRLGQAGLRAKLTRVSPLLDTDARAELLLQLDNRSSS